MKNSRRFLVRITQYNLEGQIITHFNIIIRKYIINCIPLSLSSFCKIVKLFKLSRNNVRSLNFL